MKLQYNAMHMIFFLFKMTAKGYYKKKRFNKLKCIFTNFTPLYDMVKTYGLITKMDGSLHRGWM